VGGGGGAPGHVGGAPSWSRYRRVAGGRLGRARGWCRVRVTGASKTAPGGCPERATSLFFKCECYEKKKKPKIEKTQKKKKRQEPGGGLFGGGVADALVGVCGENDPKRRTKIQKTNNRTELSTKKG